MAGQCETLCLAGISWKYDGLLRLQRAPDESLDQQQDRHSIFQRAANYGINVVKPVSVLWLSDTAISNKPTILKTFISYQAKLPCRRRQDDCLPPVPQL